MTLGMVPLVCVRVGPDPRLQFRVDPELEGRGLQPPVCSNPEQNRGLEAKSRVSGSGKSLKLVQHFLVNYWRNSHETQQLS